jgi:hypothetical protein
MDRVDRVVDPFDLHWPVEHTFNPHNTMFWVMVDPVTALPPPVGRSGRPCRGDLAARSRQKLVANLHVEQTWGAREAIVERFKATRPFNLPSLALPRYPY